MEPADIVGVRTDPPRLSRGWTQWQPVPDMYAPLAKAMAYLFGASSIFAGASSALPDTQSRASVLVLAFLGLANAALLWARAQRLSRWGLRLLAIAGTGPTALAVYLAEAPERDTVASVQLSRVHWFLTVATFLIGGILVHRLLQQLRRYAGQLAAMARTDSLTGLPNRRAWDEEIGREISRCRRDGYSLCVAVLDIDHFKMFNDTRGHQEGDTLLRALSRAWAGHLRDSDFLARYGGEEFALLLRQCTPADGVIALERLRDVMPEGQRFSAGLSVWDGREDANSVFGRADEALYDAKRAGRDNIVVAEWQQREAIPPSGWVAAVRAIVDGGTILTAFQPVIDLSGGTVVGYEALARPTGRALGYDIGRLFETARRTGLGRELDWACRHAAARGAARLPAGSTVFINVAMATLLDPLHDADQMILLLSHYGLRPETIILEVTDTEAVPDQERFGLVLSAYREHGFRFSVDDVGAGRCALETLMAASPEYIKLAPRLIERARRQRTGLAALSAIQDFASAIGAITVAEGVEDAETTAWLRERGVDWAQGHHFGRPTWTVPTGRSQRGPAAGIAT